MAKQKYIDKCEKCGAGLIFNPTTASLECLNCNFSYPLTLGKSSEIAYEDFIINKDINKIEEHTLTIKCAACGAVDILNEGDIADVCPFCGSVNIEDSGDEVGFSPNGIIPFEITKEQAFMAINEKIKDSRWVPKDFKQNFRASSVKGIYTPCFTFDVSAKGYYTAKIGQNYTESVFSNGTRSNITKTRWKNVSGQIDEFFNDIVVDAGQKINGSVLNKLLPYQTNSSIAYDRRFLNGFAANRHDKSVEISFDQSKQIINSKLREMIKKRVMADYIDNVDIQVQYENVKFKYILLPVYTSSFNYKKKVYNVFVNGVNGKTVGNLPVCKSKIWSIVICGAIIIGIAAGLIWFFTK